MTTYREIVVTTSWTQASSIATSWSEISGTTPTWIGIGLGSEPFLLEDGDTFLLEDGEELLLEVSVDTANYPTTTWNAI